MDDRAGELMLEARWSRPPWPPSPLLDLAAGREPTPFDLTPELLAAAADHRMGGLLWSWAKEHVPDGDVKLQLALLDLSTQAHLARVWTVLESCASRLAAAGIEVASIKGPSTEARWYKRPGERPCSDVDLWLSPHQLDLAGGALKVLQPDHPWCDFVSDLAVRGEAQTVTAIVDGIEVDLHLDLLKTGLATVQAEEFWDRTEIFELPGGSWIRVLDSASALFHFLVHLNKDRFQRLLGYADIARILASSTTDLQAARELAHGEGLEVVFDNSLRTVLSDLIMPSHASARVDGTIRGVLWRVIWRRRIRLRGREGRRRFRRRQLLIGALARNRGPLRCWFPGEVWPPLPVVLARREDDRGWVNQARARWSTISILPDDR